MNKRTSRQSHSAARQTKPAQSRVGILGQRLLPAAERAACLRATRRVIARATLGALDVGVVFVNDLEMQALNRAWRHKDTATDVLSFAAQEGEVVPGSEDVLGDLVISVDTSRRQARARGTALDVEIAVLVAHGLCHLAGLDHERGEAEARVQLLCEQSLLGAAQIDVAAALTARGGLSPSS